MKAKWHVIVGALLLVIFSVARPLVIGVKASMFGHSESSGDFIDIAIAVFIVGLQDPLLWIVLFIGLILIDTAVRLIRRRHNKRDLLQ